MSAVLLPRERVMARSRPVKASRARRGNLLAACVLVLVVVLEAAVMWRPELLLVHRLQAQWFSRQASGYCMLAVMLVAVVCGWLRRQPGSGPRARWLAQGHQVAGLVLLVLLAWHVGQRPSGFLLAQWHLLCAAAAAAAARPWVGAWLGVRASTALLVVHIAGSCCAVATALVHVWLVVCYIA